MTSTPVTDSLGVGIIPARTGQSQQSGKTAEASFDSFMNQANTHAADSQKESARPVKKVNDSENIERDEPVKTESTKDISKQSKEEKTVTNEDVGKVKDAIKEVCERIKEELSVTDEDIEAVLDSLGLTLFSLLDTENLPIIVTELADAENTLSLALDEDLFANLTKIEKTSKHAIEVLSKELDIPLEELESAIKDSADSKAIPVSEEIEEISEKLPVQKKETDIPMEEKVSYSRFENKSIETELISKEETTKSDVTKDSQERPDSFEGRRPNDSFGLLSFTENLISKVTEAFNEENSTISYSFDDVENVMNQITESIKFSISDESSEVSLKLHPESLGSVSVKVSANNEGAMTARFIAQNENVKAIIESQAVVLKEALEAKGVTVEAVEVMVQSHEFERNLSDSERRSEEGAKPKKKGLRRIDLSIETEETEADDDSLVKEMMAQSGNTIDYSA